MRWLNLIASVMLGACSVVCVQGCASPGAVVAEDARYTGPAITLTQVGGEHQVVLTAPTAGWSFSLDEIRDRLGGKDVFVTVRRPNPAYLHAQVLVEQHLGTEIAATDSVDVYARVLDHDQQNAGLTYYLAASTP